LSKKKQQSYCRKTLNYADS